MITIKYNIAVSRTFSKLTDNILVKRTTGLQKVLLR